VISQLLEWDKKGSKAASSSHNTKTPACISLGDDEKENWKKNGETRKIKSNRGEHDDNLTGLCCSNRSKNQPIYNYKDEEDDEEDGTEDNDSNQASNDDLDHGGRKSKKARK
jgi:hypothetical protein